MKVVFSRFKDSSHSNEKDVFTGVVSLKGEDDQCLMHSGKDSKYGEEVLLVKVCSKSKKELFRMERSDGENPSMLTILKEDGKTKLTEALMAETSGEKDVVALKEWAKHRPRNALMIENIKSL